MAHSASLKAGALQDVLFQFSASDGTGASNVSTVTITITGENDARGGECRRRGVRGGPAVLLNASYTDLDQGDTRTFGTDTTGTKGRVVNNGDGSFSYDPNGAFEASKPARPRPTPLAIR